MTSIATYLMMGQFFCGSGRGELAGETYRNLGANHAEKVIDPVVKEGFKAAAARHTAEDLILKREALKTEVWDFLKTKLVVFGIDVVEMSITDFEFSTEFSRAIEAKQTAEQPAVKAKRDLERSRSKRTRRSRPRRRKPKRSACSVRSCHELVKPGRSKPISGL